MPHAHRSRTLPLVPLLAAFRAAPSAGAPALPPVGSADTDPPEALAAAVRAFAEAALPIPFHADLVAAQVKFLRHALNHLARGEDPLADRLARCAAPGGAYFVPGLGPGFWSALASATVPDAPRWCPAVERGAVALGLVREVPADARGRFDAVARALDAVRARAADLSAA
ncbi:MAG: hypothetical protein FJ304_25650, partial [Planctomycetes bacterium]|nr:hypothetical protein [Planctomycetota bacterium]